MTGREQGLRSGLRAAAKIGCAVLTAGVLGVSVVALGQDQSAATAKDAIFARKILMDTIGHNTDELETMVETGKIDLAEGTEHADNVSVMLMAFPHLFPPSSNQWKPNLERDSGTDTFAAPEVWTRFSDFYLQASNASKLAYKVSRADSEAEFKTLFGELRESCNACHAAFLKTE
jgi:cytochrome c556